MIFAYFGPETLLPLTSIVAVAAGAIMMCGKNTLRFAQYGARALARKVGLGSKPASAPSARTPAMARREAIAARRRGHVIGQAEGTAVESREDAA